MASTTKLSPYLDSDASCGTATWALTDDDASDSSYIHQIAELKALLKAKDERIVELEAQVQAMKQQSAANENPVAGDADEEEDSQVRDQIAAVKATLKQGRHNAQATQDSLNSELENCRRLQQKLASRKGIRTAAKAATPRPQMPPKSEQASSLKEQLTTLLASVHEREQSMSEIAQSFRQGGTIPVSLYQAEIQEWKQALSQLSSSSDASPLKDTLKQSNELLQQANNKLQQLESALSQAQQDRGEEQARSRSLWKMVQKMEQDKQDEIHLLDIVMQHLLELEQEQEKQTSANS